MNTLIAACVSDESWYFNITTALTAPILKGALGYPQARNHIAMGARHLILWKKICHIACKIVQMNQKLVPVISPLAAGWL